MMTTARLRPLGAAPLAVLCAAAMGLSPVLMAGVNEVDGLAAAVAARIRMLTSEGWIMSGTGHPVPSPQYIGAVENLYLQPSAPLFNGQQLFPATYQGLTTPEQFCPFVCVPPDPSGYPPNLNFGDSVNQGANDVTTAVVPQLTAGDSVTVFGYSQSGTVVTQALHTLIANAGNSGFPTAAELQNLHSVIIGDPNNPLGGILDRYQFPAGLGGQPQTVPFFNIPVGIAPTPTSDIGTSAVYTGQYDGWANMPQDQTNILAIINALIGIATVHGTYPLNTADQLADAINIGTVGNTDFYMIPENLPILQFLFNAGPGGQFVGDFLSPWLRLIIDWGYGNAGDPAVNGLYTIPAGGSINGSPFEQVFGVAGGPWAQTPLGTLYDGSGWSDLANSGVAGLFEKMDPLQMFAGVQNALIQSVIAPWVDLAVAAGGPLSTGDIDFINSVIGTLQFVSGYDLINSVDKMLLETWNGLANLVGMDQYLGPDALLSGALIPAQGLIGLVGLGFDFFHLFGA